MELEELKKSWQTLDKHLQNRDITTEERVTELIACYKHKAERKLGNLMSLQRISLCIGLFILIAIGTICLLLPSLIDNTDTRTKLQVVLIFLAVTLIAGGSWDWRTYRYMQQTRVDLLPIAEVSRRIVKLRLWTRQEVAAISLWVLCSSEVSIIGPWSSITCRPSYKQSSSASSYCLKPLSFGCSTSTSSTRT